MLNNDELFIGKDERVGFFLFTAKTFQPKDIICEYVGVIENLSDQDETLSFEGFAQGIKGGEVGISTDNFANEGRFVLGVPPK